MNAFNDKYNLSILMLLNIITNHYEVIARRNDALPPIVPLGFALDAPAPRPSARNQLAIALRTKEERTFGPFSLLPSSKTTQSPENITPRTIRNLRNQWSLCFGIVARGRFDPFGAPSGNDRYLRTADI